MLTRRRSKTLPRALSLAALTLAITTGPVAAIVSYEEGRRELLGVQLLRDADDPSVYFYVPQFPRLSTKEDGTVELLCLKYLDAEGGASGGLFHALVEFTLPDEAVAALEEELEKEQPGARIAGPVPLMQAIDDGEEGMGSFEVVSAILSDQGEGGFTRSVVTSGKAPLTKGSKAVVAAVLNQQGATLLWESLTGPTSDVSVAIHGYYEAKVKAYNAKVTAEMDTIYSHLSRVSSFQKDYTKRQLRKVVDELRQDGGLTVEVFDRTKSLGVKADDMDGILQLVTDKLTELMFDSQAGWSQEPPRETAVEANQIAGRRKTGWFSRVFGGERNPKYVTDDQYVLKRRQDIRHHSFSLVLDKSTSIRVPVDTAGNLGGLYEDFGEDPRYFRVVDLSDPDFETREVHFQVDGAYLDAFKDTINFVSVNFRKRYADRPDVTKNLTFSHQDVIEGRTIQDVAFSRLGMGEAEWTRFEYQTVWSVRDRPTVRSPAEEDDWIDSSDAAVSLVPPFVKRRIEIDADRALFGERGVRLGVIEFATVLAGEPRLERRAVLRADDAESTTAVALYHDRDEPVGIRVSWHSAQESRKGGLEPLESDFLFLTPPDMAPPEAPSPADEPAEGGR
jgi:hypothetical protein